MSSTPSSDHLSDHPLALVPDGPELAHVDHGGDGPAILLVHGYLTGGVYWQRNLAALAAVGRPIVIDLWGHDASPSPDAEVHYRPTGVVAALDRLRTRLGVDRWIVVGHSLGAALAIHYALALPERVQALVVTNSNSAFADAELDAKRRARSARMAARIDEVGMDAFADSPLNPYRSKRLPDATRAALIDAYHRHDPVGLANMIRWTTPEASAADHLHRLAMPTLLTWGVHERLFRAGAELARDRIPGLRVVELDGSHPVNVQDPDGFDAAVSAFVEELT